MSILGAIDTLATLAEQVYHAGQIMFGGPPHPFAVDEAAPEAECCAREAGFTAPVKHGPGSRLAEPHLRRESIAAGATLATAEQLDRISAQLEDIRNLLQYQALAVSPHSPGGASVGPVASTPLGAAGPLTPPSAADEQAFAEWIASLDARLKTAATLANDPAAVHERAMRQRLDEDGPTK